MSINRLFSNPAIELVHSLIGQAQGELANRIIPGPTPNRQAYQLQPLLFTRLGAENFITSYVDIINELERLGVESCRQKLWGNTLQFNWIPPVDIDKLINFQDYFWLDTMNPSGQPQYITIENPCSRAQERVSGYQLTLDTFGETLSIQGLDATANTVTVSEDLTSVFTQGFVFFIRESTNLDVNNTFFTTVSSIFDESSNTTIITISENFNVDVPANGVVSLVELLTVFVAEQNCVCSGDVGWSVAPWDDGRVGTILWTTGLLNRISFPTEAEWVSTSPDSPIDFLDLWYDTTNDELKQADVGLTFQTVVSNFSSVLSLVEGNHFWDATEGCVVVDNQWTEQNKWVHKNSITNFNSAKQAVQPILEYDATVQLNEWNCTEFLWKYRESTFVEFEDTELKPTLNELVPFDYIITIVANFPHPGPDEVTLSPKAGDQTSVFVPGYKFRILGDTSDLANNRVYTVFSSVYANDDLTDTTSTNEAQTIIDIVETFSSATDSLTSDGIIVPVNTAAGDGFREYDEHWVLVDTVEAVPLIPRVDNPEVEVDALVAPTVVGGIGQYIVSDEIDASLYVGDTPYLYSMEWTITSAGVTFLPFDARMVGRALTGANDIRVYLDGVRQYGLFVESDAGGFVDGITYDDPLVVNSVVRIETGEPGLEDRGRHSLIRSIFTTLALDDGVRTIEDDAQFAIDGPENISLIQYRRSEQVKKDLNQYPLFDIVNLDGTDSFQANHIFGYLTDRD